MDTKDPDFRATIYVLIFSSAFFILMFYLLSNFGAQYMHDVRRHPKPKKKDTAVAKATSTARKWLKGDKV